MPYLTVPTSSSAYIFDPPCSLFSHLDAYGSESRSASSIASDASAAITILELGSGQSVASLHLIEQLEQMSRSRKGMDRTQRESPSSKTMTVYLTDLESVTPLCQTNVARWRKKTLSNVIAKTERAGMGGDSVEKEASLLRDVEDPSPHVDIEIWPLPWGAIALAEKEDGIMRSVRARGGLTHILMLDLVSF